MATNYVKFRRGNITEFELLTYKEPDTLYFIYEENELSAELYLGDKKISCGDGVITTDAKNLEDLKNIILTNIQNRDILIYNNGNWINKSIDYIIDDYCQSNKPIITSINNINNNLHQDLIDEVYANDDPSHGDIVIIKDFIVDNGPCEYIGYIYNELLEENNWCAMSGNYSAEKVYFTEDFICTESVGTIKLNEGEYSTVIPAKGKNLNELLSTIFAQEKNPIITNPSASISLETISNSLEVGTRYTPSYQVNFNNGLYEYGPYVNISSIEYYVSDGTNELDTSSGVFEEIIIDDDTAYQVSATINYGDSLTIPLTNLGNIRPEQKITSGELKDIKSNIITGYRKSFYGTLSHKNDFNVRDLANSTSESLQNGSTFTIPIVTGAMRVVIAYPANLRDLTSVLDYNDSNSNIVSGFTLLNDQFTTIGGVDDYHPIDYKVYIMDFANPYNVSNKFIVTI